MLDLGLKHITLQVPRAPADLQQQEVKLLCLNLNYALLAAAVPKRQMENFYSDR